MAKNLAGKVLRNGSLGAVEYSGKIASIPGAIMAAGSKGNVGEKVSKGYEKLVTALPDAADKAKYFTNAAYDFVNDTAAEFTEKYGGEVFETMKEGLETLGTYVQNVADQPAESAAAGAIAGLSMYGIGRAARFVRQKGKGSWLDRAERKLGKKIWKDNQ